MLIMDLKSQCHISFIITQPCTLEDILSIKSFITEFISCNCKMFMSTPPLLLSIKPISIRSSESDQKKIVTSTGGTVERRSPKRPLGIGVYPQKDH